MLDILGLLELHEEAQIANGLLNDLQIERQGLHAFDEAARLLVLYLVIVTLHPDVNHYLDVYVCMHLDVYTSVYEYLCAYSNLHVYIYMYKNIHQPISAYVKTVHSRIVVRVGLLLGLQGRLQGRRSSGQPSALSRGPPTSGSTCLSGHPGFSPSWLRLPLGLIVLNEIMMYQISICMDDTFFVL